VIEGCKQTSEQWNIPDRPQGLAICGRQSQKKGQQRQSGNGHAVEDRDRSWSFRPPYKQC